MSEALVPRMRTIQQLVEITNLTYRYIMNLCKENRIVHIKNGNRYLINLDKFIEFLNNGDLPIEDEK